jgi:hypothetical protein
MLTGPSNSSFTSIRRLAGCSSVAERQMKTISPPSHRATEKNSLTANVHEYTRIPLWPPRCTKCQNGNSQLQDRLTADHADHADGNFFATKARPPSAVGLLRRTGKERKEMTFTANRERDWPPGCAKGAKPNYQLYPQGPNSVFTTDGTDFTDKIFDRRPRRPRRRGF